MAEAHAVEKDKKYYFANQNGEENGAIYEVVNMPLHKTSSGQSEKGLALENTLRYKNKRRKCLTYGEYFNVMTTIIKLIIMLSFVILYAVRSEKEVQNFSLLSLLIPVQMAGSGIEKKCYYFSLTEGNWTAGSRHCSSHDASLAVIDSQDEKSFLFRHKSPPDHWIGLQKDLGQPWRWVNGRNFTEGLFALHTGKERRCAYLNLDAVGSSSCTREERWICSKEMAKDIGWISAPKI